MWAKGISDALQAMKHSNAVEVIDEALARNPAATVADVRQLVSRGCRSYSFDRLGTWDEALARNWQASPG